MQRPSFLVLALGLLATTCLVLGSFWVGHRSRAKAMGPAPVMQAGIEGISIQSPGAGEDAGEEQEVVVGSALGRPVPVVSGFGDGLWKPGALADDPRGSRNEFTAEQIVLHGGAYAHPHLLRGLERSFDIDFDLAWEDESQAAMTVLLFHSEEAAGHPPLQVSFSKWGKRLWVAASFAGGNRMLDGDDYTGPDSHVSVRIECREDRLNVFVDGEHLVDLEQTLAVFEGEGIRFVLGGPWFNVDTGLQPTTIRRLEVRRMRAGSMR